MIQRGPRYLLADNISGSEFFGWPVLSLERRNGKREKGPEGVADRIETRAVYANLDNEYQSVGVVKAVYWDGEREKINYWMARRAGEQYTLSPLPARFVHIPVGDLRGWLTLFDGISVPILYSADDDYGVPIRRLRIERNQVVAVLEVIWKSDEDPYSRLNAVWTTVWDALTSALKVAPVVSAFEENYGAVGSEIDYDFDAYERLSPYVK